MKQIWSNTRWFCWVGIGAAWLGCEQNPVPQEDVFAPEIHLISPQSDTLFHSDSYIVIEFEVAENDQLHDVLVEVRVRDTWEKVYQHYAHEHLDAYAYCDTLQLMVTEKTGLLLRLEAEDHHFNVNQIDYPFTVIP